VLVHQKAIDYGFKLEVEDLDGDEGKDKGKGNAGRGNMPMPAGGMPGEMIGGGAGSQTPMKIISAPRFDFNVQFCWQAPSAEQLEKISAEIPSGVPLPVGPAETEEPEAVGTPATNKPAVPAAPPSDDSGPPAEQEAPASEGEGDADNAKAKDNGAEEPEKPADDAKPPAAEQ